MRRRAKRLPKRSKPTEREKRAVSQNDTLHTLLRPRQELAGARQITRKRFRIWSEWPASDVKFDYYRAAGLLADAYARTGELEKAAQWFAPATHYSTTPETLYNYAWFLKAQGRTDEAREWVEKLMAKKRTLPGFMQRVARPWFRKGQGAEEGTGCQKAISDAFCTQKVPSETKSQ